MLIGLNSHAQYDSEGENKSRFRPGLFWYFTGYHPAKVGKVRKYDRIIFDVTYNDWVGAKNPFQNHWASLGLNTNILFDIPLMEKNRLSLGVGVCYGFQTIRHNQSTLTFENDDYTKISDTLVKSFQRNSLIGHQISIPIELRFRTNGWKHFKIHVGGKIGYQAGLYSKTHGLEGESPKKFKTPFSDPNRLIYSIHARVGIRNWALFGSYNLNTIFKNSKSTSLNMFQLGISVSLF